MFWAMTTESHAFGETTACAVVPQDDRAARIWSLPGAAARTCRARVQSVARSSSISAVSRWSHLIPAPVIAAPGCVARGDVRRACSAPTRAWPSRANRARFLFSSA
ncbi:hypothetical protein HPB50_024955 [Hyalomma asiaticum]|uniref:Uncharacterized protein n=1 Tax=Hyalomma asiaticum TaxID=266040 RepID=A0ACB7TNE7_HYAAI|nr:hypothetical protein HPB50_024955 [Hyalomma asiaticum]